jgi:hypothetical protein
MRRSATRAIAWNPGILLADPHVATVRALQCWIHTPPGCRRRRRQHARSPGRACRRFSSRATIADHVDGRHDCTTASTSSASSASGTATVVASAIHKDSTGGVTQSARPSFPDARSASNPMMLPAYRARRARKPRRVRFARTSAPRSSGGPRPVSAKVDRWPRLMLPALSLRTKQDRFGGQTRTVERYRVALVEDRAPPELAALCHVEPCIRTGQCIPSCAGGVT